MAHDTSRDKASTGCASPEGMETDGSHGGEKQKLQSYRTTNFDGEGTHRFTQGNVDMEVVSSVCTHERLQESTYMRRVGNGSTGLCGSSAAGIELVAKLTSSRLAKKSDSRRHTMSQLLKV